MSEGSRGAYGGGFVERAVRAADGAEAALDADADAADVAAVLSATLFGEVLGYGTDGYERDGRVARFRDDGGDVRVTFAAAASAEGVGSAVVAAFEAASAEPSVRYVVAGGLDRLLVFERVADDDDAPADADGIVDADATDDRRTVAGVTATTHTEIPLGDVIEAGRRGKLSQTLRPGPQIAVAKLAALRPGELAPADRYEEFDTPGDRPIDDGDDGADDGDGDGDELETLVGTLRDCLGDVLAPAVADAHARLAADLDGFDDRAATLREAATAAAGGDGDDTAAGPARRRLLAHEAAYADARALRAAYGTWVRGAGRTGFTPTENRRAFARVVAFQLVEEAFLVRVVEGMEFLDDTLTGAAVERFESFADDAGVDRDTGDLFGIARERLASVYDRRAPDLAGWALGDDDVAEALSRTVWYLDHFSFDGDPERAVAVYDRLLSVADLPRIDTDPADPDPLVPALLDAAGYTSDGWSDGGDDGGAGATDLLDPAVGDGRYLLAASDRLRAGLADVDHAGRLAAVRERLTGASPDPLACRVTETRFLLRLLDDYREARWEHGDYTLDTLPVYCTDPLIRDVIGGDGDADGDGADDAQQAHAALARDDYGYVVGAPPTTLRRDVADGPVDEAYAEYDTAYYTYDTSALYVERAGDWLAENGTLALRVAGRFRDTRFGEKLRERLPQWYRVEELREVDGVAAGGTPVLLVARRFRKNEPFTDPDEYAPPTYGFDYAEGLGAPSVRRSSTRLTGDEWVWDADGDDDEIGI